MFGASASVPCFAYVTVQYPLVGIGILTYFPFDVRLFPRK